MADSMPLLIGIVKATALLILALGISLALRRAPAGARYVVWLATLVALLLAPAMNVWAPLRLAVLPAESVRPAQTIAMASPATLPTDRDVGPRDVGPTNIAKLSAAPLSLGSILLIIWGSVLALLVGWLALGALKVRRLTRHGRPLTEESWLTPLYETADRLELDNVPRLVMSSAIEMPFACGIRRPMIALPASAEQWSDERRRVVFFHELAHIRRRDLVGHTIGRLVCAVYWFHPMVWSAARRLRAESERACDDLVIACGARASDYASHLLDIITGVRRHGAPATALAMANKREFEGRMLAILDPSLRRSIPSRIQQLTLAFGLGSLALTIAAIAPVRRQAIMSRDQVVSAPPGNITSDLQRPQELQLTERLGDDRRKSPSPSPSPSSSPSPSASGSSAVSSSIDASSVVTATISQLERTVVQQQGGAPDTALLARVLRTDKDGDVRRVAAWTLQGRRDGILLLLERLRLDQDASVRETSAWALAGHSSSEVLAALTEALRRDKDDEVRATAAWALGNSDLHADVTQLVAALDDVNAEVRRRALWAIGQQRVSQAPARVVALLKDPDENVRLLAAWTLGEILDHATIPALRDAFLTERDSDVAQATIRTLLLMGDRSQAVIDRAMSSEDPQMRARGVRMIAGQGAGNWPWPWPWPWPRPSP